MKVIIIAPYDFSSVKGNTIRPSFQCLGLAKNGFDSFELRSRIPVALATYQQSQIRRGVLSWIPNWLRPLGISNYLFDMPFYSKIGVGKSRTIVHAHNFYTFFLIPKNCIKIADLHTFKYHEIYYNYGDSTKHPNILKRWIYRYLLAPIVMILEKRICKQADKVIVASANVGLALANAFEVSMDKFVTINNTLDASEYAVNMHEAPFCIGVVGSFKDQLNREVIPEVLKLAARSSLRMELIGEILDEDAQLFDDFEHVQILGWVSDEHYKAWMSRISLLLAPYTIYRHGGGLRNKLIEAAVCATPIVTTKGGAEGFENVELLRIGDSTNELIVHIEHLRDANSRRILGQKLRIYALQNFVYERESKKLIELYESFNQV